MIYIKSIQELLTKGVENFKKTGYDIRKDKNEIIAYFGTDNPNCFALKLCDIKKFKNHLSLNELRKIDPNRFGFFSLASSLPKCEYNLMFLYLLSYILRYSCSIWLP